MALRGPWGGKHNDISLWEWSRFEQDFIADAAGYRIGGDGIFPATNVLSSTWLCGRESKEYSRSRIMIEWLFANVSRTFLWFGFLPTQKLLQTRPHIHYLCAALLANCRTCLYGNEISRAYGVSPPTLDECLSNKGAKE